MREVVHAEKSIAAEEAAAAQRRKEVLATDLYKAIASRVDPCLRAYHGLDLYTARMCGEQTSFFLQQRELEWQTLATQLFAESPSWYSALGNDDASASARRLRRKLASGRFQRVADSHYVQRLLRGLVKDMQLREFVDNFTAHVFKPDELGRYYDAAVSLARTHSQSSMDSLEAAAARDEALLQSPTVRLG